MKLAELAGLPRRFEKSSVSKEALQLVEHLPSVAASVGLL